MQAGNECRTLSQDPREQEKNHHHHSLLSTSGKMKHKDTIVYLGKNEATGIDIGSLISGGLEQHEGFVTAPGHPVITGENKSIVCN